jgi:hypothetical protein
MTITELKKQGLLLFECISGSRAYGTNTPQSDTDLKGVFVLPQSQFYAFDPLPQVSSEGNDEVYYELSRFAELLYKNNPTALEILASPEECITFCHPSFEVFRKENFLSRLCKDSFAGFAHSQVKKARGLNKKINVPEAPKRKTPLDFCYVTVENGSMPLLHWLEKRGWEQKHCGLAAISNMRDLHALYYDESGSLPFSGVVRGEDSNDIALSSIPKGMPVLTYLSFNKDAYSQHCRDYREYHDWVAKRNETRYQNTLEHGKNYDAKNLMHTIRLLETALEILRDGVLNVRRANRDELLKIRSGAYTYEELMAKAEYLMEAVETAYASTTLPEKPDKARISSLTAQVRREFYAQK